MSVFENYKECIQRVYKEIDKSVIEDTIKRCIVDGKTYEDLKTSLNNSLLLAKNGDFGLNYPNAAMEFQKLSQDEKNSLINLYQKHIEAARETIDEHYNKTLNLDINNTLKEKLQAKISILEENKAKTQEEINKLQSEANPKEQWIEFLQGEISNLENKIESNKFEIQNLSIPKKQFEPIDIKQLSKLATLKEQVDEIDLKELYQELSNINLPPKEAYGQLIGDYEKMIHSKKYSDGKEIHKFKLEDMESKLAYLKNPQVREFLENLPKKDSIIFSYDFNSKSLPELINSEKKDIQDFKNIITKHQDIIANTQDLKTIQESKEVIQKVNERIWKSESNIKAHEEQLQRVQSFLASPEYKEYIQKYLDTYEAIALKYPDGNLAKVLSFLHSSYETAQFANKEDMSKAWEEMATHALKEARSKKIREDRQSDIPAYDLVIKIVKDKDSEVENFIKTMPKGVQDFLKLQDSKTITQERLRNINEVIDHIKNNYPNDTEKLKKYEAYKQDYQRDLNIKQIDEDIWRLKYTKSNRPIDNIKSQDLNSSLQYDSIQTSENKTIQDLQDEVKYWEGIVQRQKDEIKKCKQARVPRFALRAFGYDLDRYKEKLSVAKEDLATALKECQQYQTNEQYKSINSINENQKPKIRRQR